MKPTLLSSLVCLGLLSVSGASSAQHRPRHPAPAAPAVPVPAAPVEAAAPVAPAMTPPPAPAAAPITPECLAANVPAVQNPTASELEEARGHLRTGVELLQNNRYSDAVLELRAARDRRATPNIMFNLGLALRGAGRSREATHTFRCYLDIAGAAAPADVRTQVQSAVTELQRSIGRVEIRTEPPTATITVNGERVELAQGVLEVDPGRLVIAASAEGYSTETQRVDVSPGSSAQVVLRLPQANSVQRLGIRVTNVATARIQIDGQLVGTGTIEENLRPGRHVVRVTAPDYQTFERNFDAAAGARPASINVTLDGGTPWYRHWGFWLPVSAALVGGGIGLGFGLSGPLPPIQGTWGVTVMALQIR